MLRDKYTGVGFYCDATGWCPARFRSNGAFVASGPHPDPISARILLETTIDREVEITACAGRFEIKVFDGERFITERDNASGQTRFHITIRESVTVDEGVYARSWSYGFSSVSAPGIC